MDHKVSIIIPVYNEVNTVGELLQQVLQQPLPEGLAKEIIIVESNSNDGSREVVQQFVDVFNVRRAEALLGTSGVGGARSDANLRHTQIQLILQKSPKGKGYAVREGLAHLTGDVVLIQDADLEYKVTDYPMLIQPILDGHADFVLGSRHLSAGSWKIRKFEQNVFKAFIMNLGGVFFHTFFNIVYRIKLTDPTTMYKVFHSSCIRGVKFESNRFDFDFELVAKLIRLGFVPLEVPISYESRGFEEGKKVRMFLDPILYVKSILKFRFRRIERTPQPLRGRRTILNESSAVPSRPAEPKI